ncbi:MAG: hypothetical protein M3P44_17755 [Actinomycetota bacterium]|nr:hypothetical protein [Actinomycetota bacterium]
MATGRRIPREKATAALTALLETVCAGGPHADCVTAVYVFGSYARGALTVGDVDTDIEYDARLDPGVEREMLDNLVVGRDWNTPFRKALKPARALQVMFGRHEMLVEPVLVYQRGDTLAGARARVAAITPDPAAGARSATRSTRRSSPSLTIWLARRASCSPSSSRPGC